MESTRYSKHNMTRSKTPSPSNSSASSENEDESSRSKQIERMVRKQQKREAQKAARERDEASISEKKERFIPSDEIFNRISWDSSVDSANIMIGYLDRIVGIMEIPFKEWPKDHTIPFHRIRYFRLTNEAELAAIQARDRYDESPETPPVDPRSPALLWHRELRIDRLTNRNAAPA